ncbi:MAG: cell division protein FtsW [Lachnospiraceae bacterium]|jgi:cell division protein FtsW|nr:cell division protein FtsW [Lachnospiraceae bacterium]
MKQAKKRNYYDYSLFFIIIFLLCFGVIMLYSTTSYQAQMQGQTTTQYLKSHLLGIGIGLTAMIMISKIDYHFWERFAWIGYVVALVLILLVLSPLGKNSNGATRWLRIGSLTFQPAEFAKIAIILLMAHLIKISIKSINKIWTMVKLVGITFPVVAMIKIITNNLSSAIIILGIAVVMIFIATPRYDIFVLGGGVGVGVLAIFLLNVEKIMNIGDNFRMGRVIAWLHPEEDPLGKGFQVLQSLYAIGSGGMFGKGLGNSIQKLNFLPEPQNDMIFAIICEELGLFGAVCVILMFVFMLWRFMVIANNAPDLFGTMLVIGIMAHIAIQVILNIAVVTNSMPNTGITLPFISYGGTSAMCLLAEMGLALGVSRKIKVE